METVHQFKKSEISQSQVDEEVNYILEYLKNKKQTYVVNKFVLEQAINELFETIF